MNYASLAPKVAELLAGDPVLTDQQIADALNAPSDTVLVERFVTFRTLYGELPTEQARAIVAKIRAAAAAEPDGVLADILPTLEETAAGCGVDMSNARAREFVDGLVAAEVLTADEAQAIKALAERAVSWAERNGIARLRAGHIREARALS